ncbi:hypothetical protein PHLCEN_2v4065 [Hermanssonia centrifuga]|uniref:Uncharacterized protein n=1 Tax=Hermanssonia centrifuga TaxID=98765 RepID=A0A2R6Q5D7_9APHY|nr:hypothetical protein PHLCEN_2v4065 [Hermanssonia centrifuga]
MAHYDNDGNVSSSPKGFKVDRGRFKLILFTHNESTFYAYNRRKTKWFHSSAKATPVRKGKGESIIVSDFLTAEWGRLKDDNE